MTKELNLTGGSPWGFTLSGGKDFRSPLKVSKLTPGGKAAKDGMRFGDYIIAINGEPTENLHHSDAMMMIKTTGISLKLSLSKEPPQSPQIDSKFPHEATDNGSSNDRPHPPPPPANVATPPKQQVSISSASIKRSPAAPVVRSSEPKPLASVLVPSSQPPRPSPPTQQMQNIVIDDGSVRKTSQKPQPPNNTPTKVTMTTVKVLKGSPVAKPPPPTTVTTQVGGQQPASTGKQKVVDRQGICESCNEPIRGPFASAMGRVWHPEHFVCTGCNKTLQNTTFVFEDDKIFCEECYTSAFAQTCNGCHKQILGACVSAMGLHWHQEHFTCSRCNSDLSKGDGFNMENNLLFCADCFGALYGGTCHGCNGKIGGGELWVEALDATWHSTCFVCEACRNPLEGTTFFAKLGHPYCKNCA